MVAHICLSGRTSTHARTRMQQLAYNNNNNTACERKNIVHTHTHRARVRTTNTSRGGGGTWGRTATTTIAIRRMGRVCWLRAAIYVCVAVPVAEPRLLCRRVLRVCVCVSISLRGSACRRLLDTSSSFLLLLLRVSELSARVFVRFNVTGIRIKYVVVKYKIVSVWSVFRAMP